MSERWSQAQVDLHNLRVSRENQIPASDSPGPKPGTGLEGCEDEGELQADIRAECRRRGWLCLGGSMAHKTRRVTGEFDFIVLTDKIPRCAFCGCTQAERCAFCCDGAIPPRPIVLFIECKSRTGKPSPAQLAVHAHARKLGHDVHIVRSMPEFLALL